MNIGEIINLTRYPLNALETTGIDLVARVQRDLAREGACALACFVRGRALTNMAAEAESLVPLAYPGPTEATPYFFNYRLDAGREVGPEHPLRRTTRRNLKQVAADLIPAGHMLSRLYTSPLMTEFLSRVRGQPIYRNADPYQSLNISVMEQGGCQQWHFDGGDMVTTLLLQAPEGGGVFEYFPDIRSEHDEGFDRVQRVLEGDRGGVRRIELAPGTLTLFKGRYSLHRVTEVKGTRRRLQAILGYTTQPGFRGSLESSILHYGPRVAELEAAHPS